MAELQLLLRELDEAELAVVAAPLPAAATGGGADEGGDAVAAPVATIAQAARAEQSLGPVVRLQLEGWCRGRHECRAGSDAVLVVDVGAVSIIQRPRPVGTGRAVAAVDGGIVGVAQDQ